MNFEHTEERRMLADSLNRFIAGEMPIAELVILDGLKHAILLEAPELVASHLTRFLQRQPRW